MHLKDENREMIIMQVGIANIVKYVVVLEHGFIGFSTTTKEMRKCCRRAK